VTITLPDSVASTIEIPDGAPAQPRTVANLAQPTIDLAPPAPGKPSTLSVPLPTIDLTNVLVGGAQGGQPPTPDSAGREPAATLDSAAFPPGAPLPERGAATLEHPSSQGEGEMRQRLKALWGQSSGQSLPHMTMRGSGQRRVSEEPVSTLVIRERALRATRVAKHRDSPEAGADYDLLGVLGEGGMGVVYTARQASIDREVAVKMLKPEMVRSEFQRRKFLSEAAVTGELDHPNIVPIYDLGQSPDGALFYSMKKVQGTPWSKVVAKSTLQENLETLMKVADAVAFAHSRGVIHRDLKPENIMLGEFGEVLVLDWGLAVATEGHRATPNIPSAQNIAGTPAYMAPEMATGPMELITKASDVYLLGAILYEVVTGAPPHYGKTAMDCLTAAARNKIVATTNRSELVDIARTAMATDPADRYGSVQEFQTAVREYQSHYESISLSERAENELDAATQTDDYRDYARALFAFEEAYALWSGNHKAQAGISLARLRYAGSAHRKHDYDLGLSLIEPKDPAHVDLRDRLFASKLEASPADHDRAGRGDFHFGECRDRAGDAAEARGRPASRDCAAERLRGRSPGGDRHAKRDRGRTADRHCSRERATCHLGAPGGGRPPQ
jgi:serine/threonine protein kinase